MAFSTSIQDETALDALRKYLPAQRQCCAFQQMPSCHPGCRSCGRPGSITPVLTVRIPGVWIPRQARDDIGIKRWVSWKTRQANHPSPNVICSPNETTEHKPERSLPLSIAWDFISKTHCGDFSFVSKPVWIDLSSMCI